MEKTIRINGVEKHLIIDRKDGIYHISIEGQEYEVKAEKLTNNLLTFFANNLSYITHVSRGDGGSLVTIYGKNYYVEGDADDGGHQGGAGGSTQSDGKIDSPMPGNIISVNVNEGDPVEADQAVVVIESMKMQNEITTPVAGTVAKINCGVGDQVNFGDILVEITPETE